MEKHILIAVSLLLVICLVGVLMVDSYRIVGEEGLIAAATIPQADCIITAVVGMVGLKPTLAAIKAGKLPSNRFSNISSSSASCTLSLLTKEVITESVFLSTPRSVSLFITV